MDMFTHLLLLFKSTKGLKKEVESKALLYHSIKRSEDIYSRGEQNNLQFVKKKKIIITSLNHKYKCSIATTERKKKKKKKNLFNKYRSLFNRKSISLLTCTAISLYWQLERE